MSLASGAGTATSTGDVRIKTPNSGANGATGRLYFSTGNAQSGSSGSITMSTGSATTGRGGSIKFSVGQNDQLSGGVTCQRLLEPQRQQREVRFP